MFSTFTTLRRSEDDRACSRKIPRTCCVDGTVMMRATESVLASAIVHLVVESYVDLLATLILLLALFLFKCLSSSSATSCKLLPANYFLRTTIVIARKKNTMNKPGSPDSGNSRVRSQGPEP